MDLPLYWFYALVGGEYITKLSVSVEIGVSHSQLVWFVNNTFLFLCERKINKHSYSYSSFRPRLIYFTYIPFPYILYLLRNWFMPIFIISRIFLVSGKSAKIENLSAIKTQCSNQLSCIHIRVFTKAAFGISRNSKCYAKMVLISRNFE